MASPSMTVGIFHLVRAANGPAPFHAFVRSLRAAVPAADWRLIPIFKGFGGPADARPYLDELRGLPVDPLYVPDVGFDIAAYFRAATEVDVPVVGFFNSYCELRDPRWFARFTDALATPGVGLVGATGSIESVVRNHRIYGADAAGAVAKARNYALAAGLLAAFPPFPNPHVRTNAFMLRRDHFLATRRFPIERRLASLIYESGWPSLTRQIVGRGLRAVVVNTDGEVLDPPGWARAGTFRSGDQDKTLVWDNRLTEYARATPDRQRRLRDLAWGDPDADQPTRS